MRVDKLDIVSIPSPFRFTYRNGIAASILSLGPDSPLLIHNSGTRLNRRTIAEKIRLCYSRTFDDPARLRHVMAETDSV